MGFSSGYGFTGAGNSGGSADINILKNNEYKITYFESVSTATGTVAVPTGGTIMLDQFQSGADAYVSTILNGQPTGIFPQTSGGVPVDVISFNALGDYTLSGVPSDPTFAIIYIFKIKAIDYPSVNLNNVLDSSQGVMWNEGFPTYDDRYAQLTDITGYTTFTNLTTLRTGNANTGTLRQLWDIVGTLIVDLKTSNIIKP